MNHEEATHSPRVLRKRLERKERIVDTAMSLLGQGGLENLTVGRLAKELDYTPGALYRYFPSMQVLLAHMQRQAIDSLHARIRDALAPLEGPGNELDRLRAAGRTYLSSSQGESAHEMSLVAQMLASPQVLIDDPMASETAPRLIALLLLVEQLISEAEASGALCHGPSRERAVQLWAALHGAVALGKLSRFDASLFSAQSVGEGLIENLLAAWRVS